MPRKKLKVKRKKPHFGHGSQTLENHGYIPPSKHGRGRLPPDPRHRRWVRDSSLTPEAFSKAMDALLTHGNPIPSLNEADEALVRKAMKADEEEQKAKEKALAEGLKKRKALQIKKKK